MMPARRAPSLLKQLKIGAVSMAFRAFGQVLGRGAFGDALFSALQIVALKPMGDKDEVNTEVTVHNQRGELVLSGRHSDLLCPSPLKGRGPAGFSRFPSGYRGDDTWVV